MVEHMLEGIEDATMSYANQALKRKGRNKAVPVGAAARLLMSPAAGAAAGTGPTADMPARNTAVPHAINTGEEEISDVSLATFYVLDAGNAATLQLGQKPALRLPGGGCGCSHGCGAGRAARTVGPHRARGARV